MSNFGWIPRVRNDHHHHHHHHFILGKMVKQLDWHLMIYFLMTLNQGQRSNLKVKQETRCIWVHISKPIWPRDFILGTKLQPNKAHSMTQMVMTLALDQVHRSRSNFLQNGKKLKNWPYLWCNFTYRLQWWWWWWWSFLTRRIHPKLLTVHVE